MKLQPIRTALAVVALSACAAGAAVAQCTPWSGGDIYQTLTPVSAGHAVAVVTVYNTSPSATVELIVTPFTSFQDSPTCPRPGGPAVHTLKWSDPDPELCGFQTLASGEAIEWIVDLTAGGSFLRQLTVFYSGQNVPDVEVSWRNSDGTFDRERMVRAGCRE